MKISTILDHIDNGHIALPEFQRGYVWGRNQVRALFDSLYRRHPVGGLLVWATESKSAIYRGDGKVSAGIVKLLLDGQQRMTSLYGIVRGRPPKFFDGNPNVFEGLRFHLEREVFGYYQPIVMKDDPLWIDVTELMKNGQIAFGKLIQELSRHPNLNQDEIGKYYSPISQLLGILDIDLHIEEVTGEDKTLDVVVDIFNRVNSGGTKLSKGDLALAKICADWPEGRDVMKAKLEDWKAAGFDFTLDWLLRSVNTVLTGEAKFLYLHEKTAVEVQDAFGRATKQIDSCLNMIADRLGLDHDRVFFGRGAIPVIVRYLDLRERNGFEPMDEKERDKLLFWYAQAAIWGRFSGSMETMIDQDLAVLEGENPIDKLLTQLRLSQGGLRVQADHFTAWSRGARFYSVLYMLTRMGEARDWGTGNRLKANLLGRNSKLEVHHIFPRAQLYKRKWGKTEVNALANFCFLTKETNLKISDRLPEEYFPKIEAAHPGALASQWIPQDPRLWKIENFGEFLEVRKQLLAEELNRRMEEFLHGETDWFESSRPTPIRSEAIPTAIEPSENEKEEDFDKLNEWLISHNLESGETSHDFGDFEPGHSAAIFDLVWPKGLQEGLSEPVAIALDAERETLRAAGEIGIRCFTDLKSFRNYVDSEILNEDEQGEIVLDQNDGSGSERIDDLMKEIDTADFYSAEYSGESGREL